MTDRGRQLIRVGARGSKLSLAQATWVVNRLAEVSPDYQFDLQVIKTSGDADQRTPLAAMGGTGVFVKELERALTEGEIDLAVHSAKDLPATLSEEFCLAAVPQRALVEDVLISRSGKKLLGLPEGAKIATGSPRRRAQMRKLRPDLVAVEVRGNVDTRLRKLGEGDFDAIILARAGLVRLGLEDRITEILSTADFLPTPGQGALAVEALLKNDRAVSIAREISNLRFEAALAAERSLLKALQAGCSLPIGGWARWVDGNKLIMDAVVLSLNGSMSVDAHSETDRISEAPSLGEQIAEKLMQQGAGEILNDGT
ncbi:hydroxymethylbilane synthase [bacterium]|nr:hydroxymethylbilane synthase [bacterium]MBU1651464.1 hydroxymethylbilane synthase [bacterium]